MSNNLRKTLTIALTGILAFSPLTFSEQKKDISDNGIQELQWILGISDKNWTSNTQKLAYLLETKRNAQANQFLDQWLTENFYEAMLKLPSIQHYFDYFKDHDIASIYANHLMKLEPSHRFELLAQLNLENYGVYNVGINLLIHWWHEDSKSLLRWFQATPDFYELEYLEYFLEQINPPDNPKNIVLFTKFFWELDDHNLKKDRFFEQFFYDYLEFDFPAAIAYSEEIYTANKGKENRFIDRIAQAISVQYSVNQKHHEALNWLSKIESQKIREITVRDIIFSIGQMSEVTTYVDWLSNNPISSEIINLTVQDYLESLVDKNNASINEKS